MPPVFPVTDGRRVHTQQFGESPLRQPESGTASLQPLPKRLRRRVWDISQEIDDSRHVTDIWLRTIRFPVANRGLIHANSVGNFPLEELFVEPFFPDMIA